MYLPAGNIISQNVFCIIFDSRSRKTRKDLITKKLEIVNSSSILSKNKIVSAILVEIFFVVVVVVVVVAVVDIRSNY